MENSCFSFFIYFFFEATVKSNYTSANRIKHNWRSNFCPPPFYSFFFFFLIPTASGTVMRQYIYNLPIILRTHSIFPFAHCSAHPRWVRGAPLRNFGRPLLAPQIHRPRRAWSTGPRQSRAQSATSRRFPFSSRVGEVALGISAGSASPVS